MLPLRFLPSSYTRALCVALPIGEQAGLLLRTLLQTVVCD